MTATMDALPFVDDPVLVADNLPDAPERPAMRYRNPGRGYVQVPVAMLEKEKAATVLVVSMLARRLRTSSGGVVEGVLQAHLAYELGWTGRDEDATAVVANKVSAWIQAADRTAWLTVQHTHDLRRQRTMARYRLWGRPTADNGVEYVEAPAALFDLVTEGTIDKNGFQAWLRWRAVMGANTSTSCSVPSFAKRWGVSEATARRHRSALLKAGALVEVVAPGEASVTALPSGIVPAKAPKRAPVKDHESPQSENVIHPSQKPGPLVPTGLPNRVSPPPSAAADLQEVTRELAKTASPSSNSDSSAARPVRRQASREAITAAGRLLARFKPQLVACAPHFRRGLVRWAAIYLDDGFGAEAVVRAANELTVDVVDGNHNRSFREALATLAVDVRHGACRGCGRDAEDFGHHAACDQAPASWLDELTSRESCVLCAAAGVLREELPMPVVVCDSCWVVDGAEDAAEGGQSTPELTAAAAAEAPWATPPVKLRRPANPRPGASPRPRRRSSWTVKTCLGADLARRCRTRRPALRTSSSGRVRFDPAVLAGAPAGTCGNRRTRDPPPSGKTPPDGPLCGGCVPTACRCCGVSGQNSSASW